MYKKFNINLQLFADDDGGGGAPSVDNPVVSQPAPEPASTATPEPSVVPGLEGYDPITATADDRRAIIDSWLKGADNPPEIPVVPEVTPAPEPAPAVTEPQIQIPDKFLLPDGSVNMDAFVKSYIFAEKKITEQGEQLRTMTQPQAPGTPLQEQSPTEPVQAPVQLSEEELTKVKEAWFDKFYDNPQEALKDLLTGAIKEQVDPLLAPITPVVQDFTTRQETAKWASEAEKVAAKYPDFDNFTPQIEGLIRSMTPQQFAALPNPMETAYLIVKGATSATAPKLEDNLKNPEFIKDLATNPEIRKAVLTNYANEVNGDRKPNVIGSIPGGVPPALPPTEIRSVSDATRASREFFARNLTGG